MTAAPRVTLRDRVLAHFEASLAPALVKDLVAALGNGVPDVLEGLVFDGLVQRRKTFTKGRPYQYLALGRTWPPHEVTAADSSARKAERDRARKRKGEGDRPIADAILKLERAIKTDAELSEQSFELYRAWPFYSEKFLPYVRFMDAKMKRRYLRTAKIYGHKTPELT